MSDFRADADQPPTKNDGSRSQRAAAATESQKPKSEEPPLDLFRLAVVFHGAVLIVLARDVIVGIDVAGFSDALRFICSDCRAGGVLGSRDIRRAAARFFASALFFVSTLFMPTLFIATFFAHRVVHTMTFA